MNFGPLILISYAMLASVPLSLFDLIGCCSQFMISVRAVFFFFFSFRQRSCFLTECLFVSLLVTFSCDLPD